MSVPSAPSARASAPTDLRVEDVYREHIDFVWRTARRMNVPVGALDDVVQDTFLVVFRRLGDYDHRTSVRGWIYGIVTRVVADHRRRVRRKDAPVSSTDSDAAGADRFPSSAPSPSDAAEHGEAVALLDRLLAELSADHREVLVLSKLEGMTVPEIGECVGANVNTVYSRLRAAATRFEALYAEFLADEERRGAR